MVNTMHIWLVTFGIHVYANVAFIILAQYLLLSIHIFVTYCK